MTPRDCVCVPTFAWEPVFQEGWTVQPSPHWQQSRYSLNSNEAFFAITAVSQQASNNEERYAAEVAAKSGLNWLRTEPTYEEFASTAETLLDVQEEPFAGPSIMMQYEVMKTARSNGVIVLLDGQGGDETLLGYHRYYAAWLLDHLKRSGVRGFVSAFRAAMRAGISPREIDDVSARSEFGRNTLGVLPMAIQFSEKAGPARNRSAGSRAPREMRRPCRFWKLPKPICPCCCDSKTKIRCALASRRVCHFLTTGLSSSHLACPRV